MKLHCSKLSTTSRPIMMFCKDEGIDLEWVDVDIMQGEHHQPQFVSLNPNRQVPVLDDDGFILTESGAILKYIADKQNSAAYPKELQKRARVNEMMDWFNTGLYREYGYHLTYSQVFPHHKREPEEANRVTAEWGRDQSAHWLGVLNNNFLGGGNTYLLGDQKTIADYMGAAYIAAGDLVHNDLSAYANIGKWMGTMRGAPSWGEVNDHIDGFAASTKDQSFIAIK